MQTLQCLINYLFLGNGLHVSESNYFFNFLCLHVQPPSLAETHPKVFRLPSGHCKWWFKKWNLCTHLENKSIAHQRNGFELNFLTKRKFTSQKNAHQFIAGRVAWPVSHPMMTFCVTFFQYVLSFFLGTAVPLLSKPKHQLVFYFYVKINWNEAVFSTATLFQC